MTPCLILALALAAEPTSATPQDPALRAAEAAEHAAQAAELAAESAARAAAAAQRASEQMNLNAERGGLKLTSATSPTVTPVEAMPMTPKPSGATWSGSVGAGLISLTGNARTVTFSGTALAERKSEDWEFSGKGSLLYGQSRAVNATTPEVVAEAAGLQLRADRMIDPTVSGFLLGGADTDHLKSVEVRGTGEGGIALRFVDIKEADLQKLLLRTDFAMRYSREVRFQYFPTSMKLPAVNFLGPRAGIAFRYALSKDVIFYQELEALMNVSGDSRVLANSLTKLSSRLVGNLSLGVGFTVTHDSRPAQGKLPTDTALTVGLEVGL